MHERIDDLLGDRFIQLRVFALDDQLDFFAESAGQIADQTRKAAEDGFDGNHAGAQAGGLQLVGDEAEARGALQERGFELIAGGAAFGEGAAEMHETIALKDEFADEVDEFVELGYVHADGAGSFDCALAAGRFGRKFFEMVLSRMFRSGHEGSAVDFRRFFFNA